MATSGSTSHRFATARQAIASRQTRVVLICCLGLLGGGFDLADRTAQKLVQRRLPEIESFRPVKIKRPRFALTPPVIPVIALTTSQAHTPNLNCA
jgi:hypothetical protein